MKISEFTSGQPRHYYNYSAFQPHPINHRWQDFNETTVSLLSEADKLIGELNACAEFIPNVNFFIGMHITKEATQSSKIEGTRTSMEEALLAEEHINPERIDDWQEVQNYIKAINFAISSLDKLPLSNRLLRQTHQVLMQGVRGEKKYPGEFRTTQNWIGGNDLREAVYIPPHAYEVEDLMSDLELFLHNDRIEVPHLIRIAIAHYQFESIHPFLDGNGRLGRLMINLYLVSQKVLKLPVLYISDYLQRNRSDYYYMLTAVREKNRLTEWIDFFLKGVIDTAGNAIATFTAIRKLKEDMEQKLQTLSATKAMAGVKLLDFLFKHPIADMNTIAKGLDIHVSTASRMLIEFLEMGILKEKTGFKRNRVFIFEAYLAIFEKRTVMYDDLIESQLDFFGEPQTHFITRRGMKFVIKNHIGDKYGLHYDLRFQFTDLRLLSFAVKPFISMTPGKVSKADFVDDTHEMSAFRREGTIIGEKTGNGPVTHWDEGYYTIEGVSSTKELKQALLEGFEKGQIDITIDGYKIKGAYTLKRIQDNKWSFEKCADEFAMPADFVIDETSLLTGKSINDYEKVYKSQNEQMKDMDMEARKKFMRDNNGESFRYNKHQLPTRPDKILPYE